MSEQDRSNVPFRAGDALESALLALVDDGISDIVFLVEVGSDDYVFAWVNRAFLEATGVQEGQVIGQPVRDVIPPPSNEMVLGKYDEAVRSGQKVSWEEASEYPTGTKVGLVAVRPVYDDDDVCTHLLGTVRDVTAERDALAREERARQLLISTGRLARVGAWELELESERLIWTEVTREIHGVGLDYEPTVEKALDFYPGPARDRIQRAVQVAIDQGEVYDLELPLVNAAGEELWVRTSGKPEYEDGVCVRLRGTFQDITDRKERERALAAKQAMLSRTERLAGVGSWEWDLETGHIEWSEGLYRIHELDPNKPAPSYEEQKALYVDEDFERLATRVEECVRDGTPYRVELRAVRQDGEIRHCVARGQRERTVGEGRGRLVGSLEDATERVRHETERAELQAQLHQAQKLQTIGRLAGGLAHDLNNVLTVIDGNISLLRSGLPADSAVDEEVAEVEDATARAATLTQQLLAFSRKQVLERRNVDARELIDELERFLQRLVPERIGFTVSAEGGPHVVRTDPAQFQQVIMNLVINAVDAIEGAGSITVTVGTVELTDSDPKGIEGELRPGRHVRVTVEDTGSGISPSVIQRIFDPFYTTKPKGEGTGLGLATAYGIVRQAGGDMTVESELDRGTTFSVFLPWVAAEPDTLESGDTTAAVPAGATGGRTILVVEDDASVRRVARQLLERSGHRVYEAEHGRDALELFEQGDTALDLVVSDIVMPELGGLELLERLKARRPELPVVLTSGYSETDFESIKDLDRVMLLRKPYTLKSLQETVEAALALSP